MMGSETGGLTRADVEALYEAGRTDLFRLVGLVTGDAHLAEEVVQEAYARLWANPSRVRDPSRVDAYVRTIALNLVRSRFSTAVRRRSIDDRLAGDPTGPSRLPDPDPMRGADDRALLRAGLDDLTVNQRTCVVCRYWLGLTDEEIAEATGLAAGTVKTHLRRALAKLRRELNRPTPATREDAHVHRR